MRWRRTLDGYDIIIYRSCVSSIGCARHTSCSPDRLYNNIIIIIADDGNIAAADPTEGIGGGQGERVTRSRNFFPYRLFLAAFISFQIFFFRFPFTPPPVQHGTRPTLSPYVHANGRRRQSYRPTVVYTFDTPSASEPWKLIRRSRR